ncbi:hypothetical protein HGA64_02075 [Candidatus Falkowbacteria bacterium]|nr:hypothetical protein [Candidatus Falkowbacteria bacterium]
MMTDSGTQSFGLTKYWIILKNSAQSNLVYRFDVISGLVAEGLNLVIFSFLWLSIYRQGNQIGSYSLGGLIFYFILTRFFALIIAYTDISRTVSDEIYEGKIVNYMLKPLSYFGRMISINIGRVAVRLLMFFPLIAVAAYFLRSNFHLTINSTFFLILIAIAGSLINFLFFYLMGLFAFFLDGTAGISYLGWLAMTFFSGRMVPLDILPRSLGRVLDYLPFKFVSYVPAQIILGKFNQVELLANLALSLAWLAALWLLARALYNAGLKRYESYGI